MRNVIIGTSGHIDHGKTSLIKALTGIDTDRLKEEKEKGISIDIGFSYLNINNHNIGIIDIPGHEKFIKNMLAGASSIDICLFIVAADDGIMPQTVEHFDILNLLNIKHGIVILNKCDRVNEAVMNKRINEIKEFTEDSFLQNTPIIQTSIYDSESIERLKNCIEETVINLESTNNSVNIFRMPIDRSFTIKGIGNVITGTTIGKNVNVGEKYEILPQKQLVTVKNIQSHGIDYDTLESNNRCALNISYNEKFTIKRGNVIATPNILSTTSIIDINLKCLKNSKISIKNGQRVRLYHLANEVMARVKILEADQINKGETMFAQLILEKPIIALDNDTVVIRNFSPLVTIGGGNIINVNATSCKRFDQGYLKQLNEQLENNDLKRLENIILEHSHSFLTYEQLEQYLVNIDNYKQIINNDLNEKLVHINRSVIHKDYLVNKENEVETYLQSFHQKNPFVSGENLTQVKKQFFPNIKNNDVNEILKLMNFKIDSNLISLKDFNIKLSEEEVIVRSIIIKKYKKAGYTLQKVDDIKSQINNKVVFDNVFKLLTQNGTLIHIENDLFLLNHLYNDLIASLEQMDKITLSDVRDLTNSNRKSVVAILEYLDRKLITKRIENYRVLIKKEQK